MANPRWEEPPVVISPVVGFRKWAVHHRRLWPIHHRTAEPWQPGENRAVCNDYEACAHPPSSDCGCGLYAYHELFECFSMRSFVPWIEGAIVGYGAMEIYRDGWRAEHARIVALLSPSHPAKTIKGIARYYEVPLVSSPVALIDEALRHGAPLSRDLLF